MIYSYFLSLTVVILNYDVKKQKMYAKYDSFQLLIHFNLKEKMRKKFT